MRSTTPSRSKFLSTLPARGATLSLRSKSRPWWISIHAPREGSDVFSAVVSHDNAISIHAPREGSDMSRPHSFAVLRIFLSTLPARGATAFSRPLRSVRKEFLSTLPARGATQALRFCLAAHLISIHAPREGSDPFRRDWPTSDDNFYPRSPRGERLGPRKFPGNGSRFLSTLPARGATCTTGCCKFSSLFLSTLPARGATTFTALVFLAVFVFLSTLPARGATQLPTLSSSWIQISIHAPREGSDGPVLRIIQFAFHFYPRSPRGERRNGKRGGKRA